MDAVDELLPADQSQRPDRRAWALACGLTATQAESDQALGSQSALDALPPGRGATALPARHRLGVLTNRFLDGRGWCRLTPIFLPQRGGGGAVMGRLVEVADTKLYVEERGEPLAFP